MLAVQTDSPYKTLKELVEAARAKPETIRISDSGLMAVPHTQVVMLRARHRRRASPRCTSPAARPRSPRSSAAMWTCWPARPRIRCAHKKSGAVPGARGRRRAAGPSMPDVPTMKSLGYDVVAASAAGILAPAGTPKPVVDKLTRGDEDGHREPGASGQADGARHRRPTIAIPRGTRSTGSIPRTGCGR